MKCPKCGKELNDGHMYCEECGGEVNLVPEFETEVEESIATSIKSVVDKAEIAENDSIENTGDNDTWFDMKIKKKSFGSFVLSGGFLAVIIFLLTAFGMGGYTIWQKSEYFHELLMEYHLDKDNPMKAISYMESIIERNPQKASNLFRLCDLYEQIDMEEKAQALYHDMLDDSRLSLDQKVEAAKQIVLYYEKNELYQEISEFLKELSDHEIQLVFLDYMSSTVNFSQPEGTYASLITLKLSCEGIGSIHYTTDGSVPTKDSELYSGTIFLEAGENIISAVFINEYGVAGTVVTKTYIIESKQVSPPEVLTYSGTYNSPVRIEIERNSESSIYYTTDGTAPDRNSTLYIGNLYVPLGKSTFKFVAVDHNGKISEIVTRDFNVVLDTEMTIEDATNHLVEQMVSQGKESDGHGHIVYDESHILIYEYLYPMTVSVGHDCYYFAEVLRNVTTMEQHRTGRYFGVDIRTGKIYEL